MAAEFVNKKDNMIYHQISHVDRFQKHMEPNLKPPPPPSSLQTQNRKENLCKNLLRMYNFRLLLQFIEKNFLDFKLFRHKINLKCYFVIFVYALLLDISGSISLAARQEASNCAFPQRWEGSWFQSGVPNSILIKGSTLSNRGKCIASDGDKFLLQDLKGCHRCVVIYEKHKNVLQYKESECEDLYRDQTNPAAMPMHSIIKSDHIRAGAHPNMNGHSRISSSDQFLLRSNDDVDNCMGCKGRETLQFLCEQIPGDALLYSMFREASEPVKCPLKGPFTFTYNRGHGECKNPVSNIDSCTEDSRLLLSFQACPDVAGTESTIEELTCLATWKDGNARYLVGLVSHHHATSNEERFRCFVYEKITAMTGGNSKDAEYKLAQSGDATCNGLESAEVGSRIMSLKKAASTDRCSFPKWFQGPRHWHALMGNAGYVYHPSDGSLHILKQSGYMETRALCEQINKQTEAEVMAIVHYTTGCQSGFMCMMFYRRDTHVAELQIGKPASRLEDACAADHFDLAKMPFVTLLASNPETQACQVEGLYSLRGPIGPPFMSSRHKRNHNNNNNKHGHHHHEPNHRRHETLSFRNTDDENRNWHVLQGRSITDRSRRSVENERNDLVVASKVRRSLQDAAVPRTSVDLDILNSTATSNDTLRNRRDVPGCITNYKAQRQLLFGCTDRNLIEVRPQCNEDGDEVYSCHGSWVENDTIFIIARHAGSQHGVCLSYKVGEGNTAQLIVGDACFRRMQMPTPPDHHLVANLTNFGSCSDTNSSNTVSNYWILIFVISWLFVKINPR